MDNIKLFVFDLHGTLTPKTKVLDRIQRHLEKYLNSTYTGILPINYTSDMYVESLQHYDYNVSDLCPKFGLLSDFTNKLTKDQHVSVASRGTSEPFAYAILKYCYDKQNIHCPFLEETIISRRTIRHISSKIRHIRVIIDRLSDNGVEITLNEVLMIDNSRKELDSVNKSDPRVKTLLVTGYFSGICQTHGNNGHYVCLKCPGMVFCEEINCH